MNTNITAFSKTFLRCCSFHQTMNLNRIFTSLNNAFLIYLLPHSLQRSIMNIHCFYCDIFLVNLTKNTHRVDLSHFELLKVLGTGGNLISTCYRINNFFD